MGPNDLSHRRTHNLLLISKLLNQRDHASPLTLILDTLEQPAKPLLKEYLRRSKISRTQSIFLSFETSVPPSDVDAFIPCWDKEAAEISKAVASAVVAASSKGGQRCLLLIDSLANISMRSDSGLNLTGFLSSLLQPPRTSSQVPISVSLVAVYHTDIPVSTSRSPYSPSPLSLLSYLATTIMTVHSLPILLAGKAAAERSLAAPSFGLAEQADGVVIGLKPLSKQFRLEERGLVVELEHRRKSGRGVHEWYFLPSQSKTGATPQAFKESATLLDDHPLFQKAKEDMTAEELSGMTFELGLTDRQKQEREGVVLPYFDAQKVGGGTGEGGRILYDMGAEDDFDEEEDEV